MTSQPTTTSKTSHLFPYRWRLADGYPAKGITYHGKKVFGTFVCGGGSAMGYKLAGYNYLGGVELDPKVMETYVANNHPQLAYCQDIRDFNARQDLPQDLYDLDLLDGSPPCSTFAMCGSREKAWGKEKMFAEGQKMQRLDDLVFVYCDTIAKLKPKACLLENVSGLVKGNGKAYARAIMKKLDSIGYRAQLFLLNAASMGVPQRRERVFIIGLRKDFDLPPLRLQFSEPPIFWREIQDNDDRACKLTPSMLERWNKRKPTDLTLCDVMEREYGVHSCFNHIFFHHWKVAPTMTATSHTLLLWDYPRFINDKEQLLCSTFPLDYSVKSKTVGFYIGMSVPPVMTAQIANQIYEQWLKFM